MTIHLKRINRFGDGNGGGGGGGGSAVVETLNITKVGSPVIADDFIVSGFSANNYLSFPIVSPNGNKTWKIRIKFRFTQLSDTNIIDAPSDQKNFRLGVGTNGLPSKELSCLFSNGNNWINSGNFDLGVKYETANEWWWLEIGYDSTTSKLFVNKSLDGETFSNLWEYSISSSFTWNEIEEIGKDNNATYLEFDLKELKQYIGDVVVYQGTIKE